MGADPFESFVGSIIAAAFLVEADSVKVMQPFWVSGAGIVASVVGYFVVGTRDDAKQAQLLWALHKGTITASIFVLIFLVPSTPLLACRL